MLFRRKCRGDITFRDLRATSNLIRGRDNKYLRLFAAGYLLFYKLKGICGY